MPRAPKRRQQRSSRKTYKRMKNHANRTVEHPPAPVVTYRAEDLPPDSALRRPARDDRD